LFPIANSFHLEVWNFLNANKVITGTAADARRVEAVGTKNKIGSRKIFKFFRAKEYLNGYQWEYKLMINKLMLGVCLVVKLLFIQDFACNKR
jgi:hypothetical protein